MKEERALITELAETRVFSAASANVLRHKQGGSLALALTLCQINK